LVDPVGLKSVPSGFVGDLKDVRGGEVRVGVLTLRSVKTAALADYDRVEDRIRGVEFAEGRFVGGLVV
jgi:hypothetical protein